MTAQDYILQRLEGIKKVNIESDEDLATFVYNRILSKKFRKYSISPLGMEKIRKAIDLNIQNNEPIKIAIPYGAYKLWRFEESPEVDWAELFAMIYFAYWLKPITDVYKPGVWFDFCGDDAILEYINNTPPEHTERYKKSFRVLLNFIKQYLPDNFSYTFSPVGERYGSKEEFLADLDAEVTKLESKTLSPLTEKQIEMIRFNIHLKPGEELDVEKNRLLHDAYMDVSKRRPHHKADDKILISATPFGDKTSIPVGTTKSSVVKFQTGVGVLEKKQDELIENIYSPSQIEKSKFEWESVDIPRLPEQNFKRIRIVTGND